MNYKKITALITAVSLLLCGCSSFSKERDLTYTDTLFDTVIRVQILDPADEDILKGVEKLCKKYDTMFSRTNPESEISKINNSKGEAVSVSEDTTTIIKKGIYYSEMSKGAFDISIGSVSSLWDFKTEDPSLPSKKALTDATSHVNYQNIVVSGNTVRLADPNMLLDVGAIAKGYIADRVKEYLEDNGVKHATINLGGNVQTIGTKPDGSPYNIGIQKPFDESGQAITSVKVKDQSVVTTGTYQRYFEKNDIMYHHILDPKTGSPCENNLQSVTIITDSSLTADALSTTCFLLGLDKGMNLIDQLKNVDAVFITDNDELHYSKNFQK